MDNEMMIKFFEAIDMYDEAYDLVVDARTKENLKALLLSGADPTASEFRDKFPEESYLYRKSYHIYENLIR